MRLTRLSVAFDQEVARGDTEIGAVASIARVSGTVRDQAGRKQTLLVGLLSSGKPLDLDLHRRYAELDGQMQQNWTRIAQLIELVPQSAGLAAARDMVRHQYYELGAPVYDRVLIAAPEDRYPGGDVAGFRHWGIPVLQSILHLRDVALVTARERIDEFGRSARFGLILALLAAGAIALGAAACVCCFGRRVVYPLIALAATIERLADGDRQVGVPYRDRRDEIGSIAKALETLRRNAIAAADQEARNAAERDAREAEIGEARRIAETASRTKSEFLANMSHELRTPLNAVIGFAEVLERELFGELGDRRYKEYAKHIRSSGSHLLRLINDILDVSKIEAGKMEVVAEPFDLRWVLEAALAMLRPKAAAGGVIMKAEIAPEIAGMTGDETRMKQVVLNLLSNAVKFTPPGGAVVLAAREASGELVIELADTGIGIDEADLGRVLEPFVQAAPAGRPHEGTGLGLPLSKRLTEEMGGTLALASQIGLGTTVTLRFPAPSQAALAA